MKIIHIKYYECHHLQAYILSNEAGMSTPSLCSKQFCCSHPLLISIDFHKTTTHLFLFHIKYKDFFFCVCLQKDAARE